LIEVAKRLSASINDAASLGRLGGDEFVIIMEISSLDQVTTTAKRLLQILSTPMTVSGHQIQITATIGISIYPKEGQDVHELLRTADIAMYQGKHTGRDTFVIYDSELDLRRGK
jgi:diguanylate cyclase (GGDEF)-like protein